MLNRTRAVCHLSVRGSAVPRYRSNIGPGFSGTTTGSGDRIVMFALTPGGTALMPTDLGVQLWRTQPDRLCQPQRGLAPGSPRAPVLVIAVSR